MKETGTQLAYLLDIEEDTLCNRFIGLQLPIFLMVQFILSMITGQTQYTLGVLITHKKIYVRPVFNN